MGELMSVSSKGKPASIETLKSWVIESTETHNIWHKESWQDCAFRDGAHWTARDRAAMLDKEINPITANRIFPVINLMLGYKANNPSDLVAKGRTQMDSEISQVMSEGMKYVLDQCDGAAKLQDAFIDQIVPGFGYLKVDQQPDPRRETVTVKKFPWYTFGWDVYGDNWLDPQQCRYCFHYDWKDLDSIIDTWPEKKGDIESEFRRMGDTGLRRTTFTTFDIGAEVEAFRNQLRGGGWADNERRRVRPVELYYAVDDTALFSIMPDGRVYEVRDSMPVNEQFALIRGAEQTIKAKVKKIRMANFLGDLILDDQESPHGHDMYPFVPFFGYLDRFSMPFGVPRQLKEQQMEVNKRRSMALALLYSKRMVVEEGAVEDPNRAFSEMNARMGLIEVREGKIDRIKIDDLSDLAAPQIDLMRASEQEIKEIAGANDEALGYKTPAMSGTALERKQQQSGTMTATLHSNFDRSQRRLGELVMAEIQANWTGPKVLRITDRMTGADRFVELNKAIIDAGGNTIEIKNNISNGRFDCIIGKKPMSDTVREQNAELLFNAIQKAPPEAIPELLSMAFELSDMPQKDMLLTRLRRVLGVEEIDPMLSKDEQEAIAQQQQAAMTEKANADAQYDSSVKELDLQKREADIQAQYAEIEAKMIELRTKERELSSREFQEGFRMQQEIMKQRQTRKPVEAK
jgi:hypothetical protein